MIYLRHDYWETLKWVLRYMNWRISSGLMYKWSSHSGVDKNGFVDTIQVMLISKKKKF